MRSILAREASGLACPSFGVLPLLASVALVACGGDDGHDHDHDVDAAAAVDASTADAAPRQVVMENRTLVPSQLVEGVFTGGPSDMAVIHIESSVAELDWNIHGHAGGGTQTVHEEFNKMVVDYTFVPTAETDWFLLLRNGATADLTLSVRVELYGDMQWRWE